VYSAGNEQKTGQKAQTDKKNSASDAAEAAQASKRPAAYDRTVDKTLSRVVSFNDKHSPRRCP